jgi:hypothetical protein
MFGKLRRAIVDRVLLPRLVRAGWRRSEWSPTGELYLQPRFGYEEEDEIKQAVRVVRSHAWVSFEKLATLWQQVRHLDRYAIPGAFVECGVYKGGSVGMMALAHRQSCPTPHRELHLFDSFEGLPEPKAELDGEAAVAFSNGKGSGALKSTGKCVGTLDDNKRLLEDAIGYPTHLIRYHQGWFQDTIPCDAPGLGPIALLRLDGDWYESTKIALDHLYDKVVPGGFVIEDDYGFYEGSRRAVDEFLKARGRPVYLHHVDAAARYWIKED